MSKSSSVRLSFLSSVHFLDPHFYMFGKLCSNQPTETLPVPLIRPGSLFIADRNKLVRNVV